MSFFIILRFALQSLRRAPMRSGLTALGIIVGVATVIAMVAIGSGARVQVEETLVRYSSDRLMVTASMPRSSWRNGKPVELPRGDGLDIDDYKAIRQAIQGITTASVIVNARVPQATANGKNSKISLVGVDTEGFDLVLHSVIRGAPFGMFDVENATTVCLVTEFVAANLFANQDPIGRWIRIKDTPCVIIGILADKQDSDPYNPEQGDTVVLIPYTSVLLRLNRTAPVRIAFRAGNPIDSARVQRDILDLLEARRGDRRAEFKIGSSEDALRRYRESSRTMTLLLGSIGGISLLVGGIGIMNVMLVSVTERTREIGIRLAIGTRRRDVLRQFLVESTILSIAGGAIGIIIGIAIAHLITSFYGWPTRITLVSVLTAFLCSTVIGISFGYYPARRAAALDPIDALRAD